MAGKQTILGRVMTAIRGGSVPSKGGQRRDFNGAKFDRLTSSWMTINLAIDMELRGQLDALRARSRDLFKNNEYAARFGHMIRDNVVGADGFTFTARSMDPNGKQDAGANKAIEAAFYRWMQAQHCDVRGKQSFIGICRSLALALARDGEYLVRRVRGRGEFGYQLQVLDVSRLDTKYNQAMTDGSNAIIMGVEVDAFRKPVAYHIFTAPPSMQGLAPRQRERIPAAEIIHGFMPLEDEQTRGVPMLHAAMRLLNDLGGYREAAVIAARLGATKMGFFISPDGQSPTGDNSANKNEFIQQAEPGTFDVLPEGYDFKEYNPAYPHAQFDAFIKGALRGVAAAVNVSYGSLSGDRGDANFGSQRVGMLDEREGYMGIQRHLIDEALFVVFNDWLEQAMVRNKILLDNGSPLPIAKIDKFREHQWLGRRWQWIDPLKDMEANIAAINNGLSSPQMVAQQSGHDIEAILDDLANFRDMVKARDLTLVGLIPTGAPSIDGADTKSTDKPVPEKAGAKNWPRLATAGDRYYDTE